MNLSNAARSQLSRVPGLNRAIDFICARANVAFGAEHNNETGVHTDITADSIVTTGDAEIGGDADISGDATVGGSLTFENADTPVIVDGDVIGPETRDNYSSFPLSGSTADASTPVLVVNRTVVPSTDNASDLGYTGDTDRRWRNGLFSNLVQAQFLNATTGVYERGRQEGAMGEWIAVTFAAGNFTASAGNWTLTSPDQLALSYTLVGKTMTVSWALTATTVSVTPAQLKITIPGGFTAATRMANSFLYNDNGTVGVGYGSVAAGSTFIFLLKDTAGTAWATATDNTAVEGQISFEVQ